MQVSKTNVYLYQGHTNRHTGVYPGRQTEGGSYTSFKYHIRRQGIKFIKSHYILT